jgi:hypothetical protein
MRHELPHGGFTMPAQFSIHLMEQIICRIRQ